MGDSLDEPAIELGAPMEDEPIPSRLFQPARDAGPARRGRESYDTVKTQTRQPAGGAAQEFFALGGQGDRGPLAATISLGPGTPIDAVAD